MEKLWRRRIHSFCDRGLFRSGQSVTNGAVFLVDFRTVQQILFIRGHLRLGMRQFVKVGVQPQLRQLAFERHWWRERRHRGASRR